MSNDFGLTPHIVHDEVPDIGAQDIMRNPLYRMGMDKSIEEGYVGRGIIIGIVDTGYQEHVDYPNAILVKSFGDKDTRDYNGHGTHVRCIVLSGLPAASQIITKALDKGGNAYSTKDIADAIIFCADNNAHVINLSLGGGGEDRHIVRAIRYAYKKNCVVVCSAGNNGGNLTFPASMREVVATGALSWNDKLWRHSSRDERLDIVAYGDQIVSGWRDLRNEVSKLMRSLSGTSMAAPWVAAECGRIIEIYMRHYNEVPANHVTINILYKAAEILNGIPYGNGKVRGLTTQVFQSIINTADTVDDHLAHHPALYEKHGWFKRVLRFFKLC